MNLRRDVIRYWCYGIYVSKYARGMCTVAEAPGLEGTIIFLFISSYSRLQMRAIDCYLSHIPDIQP